MEHRTKPTKRLIALVSEFERDLEQGNQRFLKEKSYLQIVEYYGSIGDLDKALEVVDAAIEQHSYRSEFYILKAKLLIRTGDLNNAHEVLDRAAVIAPFEHEVKILRAKAFAMCGMSDEASEILSELKSISVESDLVEVLLCESYLYEYLREDDLMFKVLKKALKLNPNNEEVLERILVAVELGRKYDKSIKLHKKLLDINPYNYLAWYNLGHAYGSIGEYEEAIICMEYSYIVNSNFELGYLDCADYAYQIQDYCKALECYQDVIRIFGEDSEFLILAAECQLKLGQTKNAKLNLYKALKQDPYNEELYFHLANCYVNEESWYTAINAFHKAISIEEEREEFYLGLARAYVEIENIEKAIFFFEKSVLSGTEETIYWKEYTLFLIKQGKLQAAMDLLDRAEEYTFSVELMFCRASIYLLTGKDKEAYELLEEALLEDYNSHKIIFEIQPEFQVDSIVSSMISYYKGEIKI